MYLEKAACEVETYKRENAQLSQQLAALKQSLITPESLMDSDIKVNISLAFHRTRLEGSF